MKLALFSIISIKELFVTTADDYLRHRAISHHCSMSPCRRHLHVRHTLTPLTLVDYSRRNVHRARSIFQGDVTLLRRNSFQPTPSSSFNPHLHTFIAPQISTSVIDRN